MKHIELGNLEVSRIGPGAMGMSHGYGPYTNEALQVAPAWLLAQGDGIAPHLRHQARGRGRGSR